MSRLFVRPVITVVFLLALLLPLSAEPAHSQAFVFADTFSRVDVMASPTDSLGTTEPGMGQTVLDYRELSGFGGGPQIADIAQIETGKLVVHGSGTTPAWAELDNAGPDLFLQVDAEFLTSHGTPLTAIANSLSLLMRNAGSGTDGTVFTPGCLSFDLRPDGAFSLRSFGTGMYDPIELIPMGYIDTATFRPADLDNDGQLEAGERFTIRFLVQGSSFHFYFNGVPQVAISTLPTIPAGADRLLFGRNRWQFSSVGVSIRFDNLQALLPLRLSLPLTLKL